MTCNIIMRDEIHKNEYRAPLIPKDILFLKNNGFNIAVEQSNNRIFKDESYIKHGINMIKPGSWIHADKDTYILGLKELPFKKAYQHKHIYFSHTFKNQNNARNVLKSFIKGRGTILDIEYLVDNDNQRLISFSYWAGYCGASLSLLSYYLLQKGKNLKSLSPVTSNALLQSIYYSKKSCSKRPRVIIMGYEGKAGTGAVNLVTRNNLCFTGIDLSEFNSMTSIELSDLILSHDIIINTVAANPNMKPFITSSSSFNKSNVNVICDISCDVYNPFNMLPFYNKTTDWISPERIIKIDNHIVKLIAIDNLPSLLPLESSIYFSQILTPLLLQLSKHSKTWQRCFTKFQNQCSKIIEDEYYE